MRRYLHFPSPALWQAVFLVAGVSWLFAPSLNTHLSYRLSLISQYETGNQPYAWLFRTGDVLAALLLLVVVWYRRKHLARLEGLLLLVVGTGMLLDPLLTTNCQMQGSVCIEYATFSSIIHGIETIVTALALLTLTLRDSWLRRALPSVTMVLIQLLFGVYFVFGRTGELAKYATICQYMYEAAVILWLAWFVRERLWKAEQTGPIGNRASTVRRLIALWVGLNAIFAIVSSLPSVGLLGRVSSLYFGSGTAWLSQHAVLVGVVMLYLSRHILRGEQRARQLLLAVFAIELGRYALVAPRAWFVALYLLNFVLLYSAKNEFQRGLVALTWRRRLQDLAYLLAGLLAAGVVAALILTRNPHVASVTARSIDHFGDYVFTLTPPATRHIDSVLLAHTISVFLTASVLGVFWVLFKPSYRAEKHRDSEQVMEWLRRYSQSSEDYFKCWPGDKSYFWDENRSGFVAYRVAGNVAFALADPIAPPDEQPALLTAFVRWVRAQGLGCCFMLVNDSSKPRYEEQGLTCVQVGASALVDATHFTDETSREKWWRWKLNRAKKQGYVYQRSQPPHAPELLQAMRLVSDAWLAQGGHQERAFALGYFDPAYLNACVLHYLHDESGKLVAFVNQLPTYGSVTTATIDLLRYVPEAQDAMPYLLAQVIEAVQQEGRRMFDLGFVPFAATTGAVARIGAVLSTGKFSAKGLEQFKNKFDPAWQPNYIAYDGDLADLAAIALNLEKAMNPPAESVT